jgi:hypothetical protein
MPCSFALTLFVLLLLQEKELLPLKLCFTLLCEWNVSNFALLHIY